MAGVNTKAINELIKKVQQIKSSAIKKTHVNQIGKEVVKEMKDLISKGISPIRGKERFPAYKRAEDKSGYPNNVGKRFPGKKKRPVNLTLSGDMLNALIFRAIGSGENISIEVGYFDEAEALKEKGHREGTNGQPKRPTIPQGNEQFTVGIQTIAEDILVQAMSDYIKKL